jgi:pilus assembly protein CpaC
VVSVKDTIGKLLPDTSIDVTAVNSDLFLTGTVRSADIAENASQIATRFVQGEANVVNLLTIIEDQQVLLQVRVAEISRSVLKELGFDLNATLTSGDFATTFGTASTLTSTPFLNNLLSFTPNAGDQLTMVINALEQNGLIKTLAEPNLTTISGEPATFLAGGEFPIPQSADNGQIAISLEPFGVALNFTPVVLNSGRISLRIFTEVSALSTDGAIRLQDIQVPSLTVRRAETTVELPTGGSLVIAGLLQDNMTSTLAGVPGLQNLPILGPFFRSHSQDRTETELIVAVTAFLVHPVERQEVALPTDGITAPSDYEFYFVGRLQGMYAKEAEGLKTAELKGPIGYIVE